MSEHYASWTVMERFLDLKERFTELTRELAQLSALAVAAEEVGTAASWFVTSKAEIETWGKVGELWGADIDAAIEPESPLKFDWWAAILDCPDPNKAREIAHHEQLGKTQIRRRFGVVRHPVPDPPAYRGRATVARCSAGVAAFNLDLAEELPDLTGGEPVDLVVKRRAK